MDKIYLGDLIDTACFPKYFSQGNSNYEDDSSYIEG